jgi:HK97 gp10 family phage protein
MAEVAFVPHPGAFELLTHSPVGPVARDLGRRALRVEIQAKLNASHPPPSQPGTGPAVRTGRLRSSITWQLGRDGLGLYADIGSSVAYARFVEVGTDRMAARPYLRPALNAGRG